MERVSQLLFRGRHAVIALEVLLAGGCAFAGWRVTRNAAPPPVTLHRATPAPPSGPGLVRSMGGNGRAGKLSPSAESPLVRPSRDLVDRLNRSDRRLYEEEWQVLQLMMAGIRDYIEHRLLPSLFAHN